MSRQSRSGRWRLILIAVVAVTSITTVLHLNRLDQPTAVQTPVPAVAWQTQTAGWSMPMPANDDHAGIAVSRVTFLPGSDGASVKLQQVVIERRRKLSNPHRSELSLTLKNTFVGQYHGPGVQHRGPDSGKPRTRFGDVLKIEGPQLALPLSSADQPVLTLEQIEIRLPGQRASCAEEPCYIYLTLNEWDAAGQHVAHSRSYPINVR